MKFYYCDPTLNEACPKTFCQGECRLTTREEYAVTDEFKKPLIVYIDNEAHELISVSSGCLKSRTGRFVVYDVEYLKSHIEQEAAIYGNVSAITGKTEDRPKGRWIDIQYFKADITYYRPKCPFCSIEPKEYSNFCPNCGARMAESEEGNK